MQQYQQQTYDAERALYGIHDAQIIDCDFAGPADGESALKETANLSVQNCRFYLRYPLWHVDKASILDSQMFETCRAPLWYDRDISVNHCEINGIKALRESAHVVIKDCEIVSPEFGWFCTDLSMTGCTLSSEYPFLKSRKMQFERLHMQAKYAFQYVENVTFQDCELNTKDAFWHSKNVTVTDSVVNGEYLGWYSENLHLVRCKIIGTQPLCYAKGLVLEDCEMEGADLAFEKSDVQANVRGKILSVKNPHSGCIVADEIGEVVQDADSQTKDTVIQVRSK